MNDNTLYPQNPLNPEESKDQPSPPPGAEPGTPPIEELVVTPPEVKPEAQPPLEEKPPKAAQPTEQPVEQPTEQPVEQPVEQPTEQPVEQPTEQPEPQTFNLQAETPDAEQTPATEQPPAETETPLLQPETPEPPAGAPVPGLGGEEKPKKKKTGLIIGLAIVGIAIIGTLVYLYSSGTFLTGRVGIIGGAPEVESPIDSLKDTIDDVRITEATPDKDIERIEAPVEGDEKVTVTDFAEGDRLDLHEGDEAEIVGGGPPTIQCANLKLRHEYEGSPRPQNYYIVDSEHQTPSFSAEITDYDKYINYLVNVADAEEGSEAKLAKAKELISAQLSGYLDQLSDSTTIDNPIQLRNKDNIINALAGYSNADVTRNVLTDLFSIHIWVIETYDDSLIQNIDKSQLWLPIRELADLQVLRNTNTLITTGNTIILPNSNDLVKVQVYVPFLFGTVVQPAKVGALETLTVSLEGLDVDTCSAAITGTCPGGGQVTVENNQAVCPEAEGPITDVITATGACEENTLLWTEGYETEILNQESIGYCAFSPEYTDAEQQNLIYNWEVYYEGTPLIGQPDVKCSGSLANPDDPETGERCGPCFSYKDLDKTANIRVRIDENACQHLYKYEAQAAEVECKLDVRHEFRDQLNFVHVDGLTLSQNLKTVDVDKEKIQKAIDDKNIDVEGQVIWTAKILPNDLGEFKTIIGDKSLGNKVEENVRGNLDGKFNQIFDADESGFINVELQLTTFGVSQNPPPPGRGIVTVVNPADANLITSPITCTAKIPVKAKDEEEVICSNLEVSFEENESIISKDEEGNVVFSDGSDEAPVEGDEAPLENKITINAGELLTFNYDFIGSYEESNRIELNWDDEATPDMGKIMLTSAYDENEQNTTIMDTDGENQAIETAEKSFILKVYENAVGNSTGNITITGPTAECIMSIPFEIPGVELVEEPVACAIEALPESIEADGEPHRITINLDPPDYLEGNYAINIKNVLEDRATLGTGLLIHEERGEEFEGVIENVRTDDEISISAQEAGYFVVELLSDTVAQVVDCSDEITVTDVEAIAYVPPEDLPYQPPEELPEAVEAEVPVEDFPTYTGSPSYTGSPTYTGDTAYVPPTTITVPPASTVEASVVHPGAPEEIGGDTGPEAILYLGLLGLGYFLYIRVRRKRYNN